MARMKKKIILITRRYKTNTNTTNELEYDIARNNMAVAVLNIYNDHDIISRWFRFLRHFNLLMHHYQIFMFNIKLMMTAFSKKHSDIIWHTLPNLLFILATDKWISRNQFLRSLPLYKYCEWQANDNYCL